MDNQRNVEGVGVKRGNLVRLSVPFYADVGEGSIGVVVRDPEKVREWGRELVRVMFPGMIDWFPTAHLEVVE